MVAALRNGRGMTLVLLVYLPLWVALTIVGVALGGAATWSLIVPVTFLVLVPFFLIVRGRAVLDRQVPVGSTISVEFGPESFTVTRRGSVSTQDYTQFTEARRWRDIVLLRQLSGQWQVVPGALVAAVVASRLGPLAERHGYRPFVVPGALVWAGAYLWYHQQVGVQPAFLAEWLPGQVLSGIGVGATLPLLGSAALAAVPGGRYATASAVVSYVALGVTMCTAMLRAVSAWLLTSAASSSSEAPRSTAQSRTRPTTVAVSSTVLLISPDATYRS
jgi:hypothetical protein